MKEIRTWIRELEPEDRKELLENIAGWVCLMAIVFMLSGICV